MTREEQARKNLELAAGFAEHLLEHPSELDAVPDGSTIVLIPRDDPELAEANLRMAGELVAKCQHRHEDAVQGSVSLTPPPA